MSSFFFGTGGVKLHLYQKNLSRSLKCVSSFLFKTRGFLNQTFQSKVKTEISKLHLLWFNR